MHLRLAICIAAACALIGMGCSMQDAPQGVRGLMGRAGPPGPAGDPGLPGLPGSGQLVYRDSQGRYVGPADRPIDGSSAEYVDAGGIRWRVDVESVQVISNGAEGPFFDGPGCTGTAYVRPSVEAGVSFMVGGESFFRALPWGLAASQVHILSSTNGAGCTADDQSILLVPIDSPAAPSLRLPAPVLSFTGPLHLERE